MGVGIGVGLGGKREKEGKEGGGKEEGGTGAWGEE